MISRPCVPTSAALVLLALAVTVRADAPDPRLPIHFTRLVESGAAGDSSARHVYHGGLPATRAQYDFLMDDLHVKTIVSLEGDLLFQGDVLAERRELRRRERAGRHVTFIHVPLRTGHVDAASLDKVIAMLADPALQPIYFHCHLGADRTELVAGLFRVRELGQPPGRVRALMGRGDFIGEAGGDSAAFRHRSCAALGHFWDAHHGEPRVESGYEGHEHELDLADPKP